MDTDRIAPEPDLESSSRNYISDTHFQYTVYGNTRRRNQPKRSPRAPIPVDVYVETE